MHAAYYLIDMHTTPRADMAGRSHCTCELDLSVDSGYIFDKPTYAIQASGLGMVVLDCRVTSGSTVDVAFTVVIAVEIKPQPLSTLRCNAVPICRMNFTLVRHVLDKGIR